MEIYEILPGYINVHKMHLTYRYLISYFSRSPLWSQLFLWHPAFSGKNPHTIQSIPQKVGGFNGKARTNPRLYSVAVYFFCRYASIVCATTELLVPENASPNVWRQSTGISTRSSPRRCRRSSLRCCSWVLRRSSFITAWRRASSVSPVT